MDGNPAAPGRAATQTARRGFDLRFMGETISELRRVTWPARQETMRLTVMVLTIAAAVGLFLYAFDLAFAGIFDVLLGN